MANNIDIEKLLPDVIKIARSAGNLILKYYQTTLNVEQKEDSTPVTEADREAEKLIIKNLKVLTPDIPIIAEESSANGIVPEIKGDYFWLVDPLDGTKEFITGSGEFTVNIALIKKDIPVLGVVFTPVLNELYSGHGENTATVSIDNGNPIPISVRQSQNNGITVVASRRHGDAERTNDFLKKFSVANYASRGSSPKFCLLASGQADIYPCFGATYEWDTAAGDAVLRSAGGCTYSTTGSVLLYGKKDFWTPEFIAATRPFI